jgi:hypothetical protein
MEHDNKKKAPSWLQNTLWGSEVDDTLSYAPGGGKWDTIQREVCAPPSAELKINTAMEDIHCLDQPSLARAGHAR